LAGGSITFVAADGKQSRFAIGPDGRYLADRLPQGELKVVIETESIRGMFDRAAPPGKGAAIAYVPINRRYAVAQTSGLAATTLPGAQQKDFAVD
jgi:hypothetical protein